MVFNVYLLGQIQPRYNYVPPTEGEGGRIAFGADPVGVRVAHCLHSYLLNQWVDFDQTCTTHYWEGGKK